MQHVGSQEMKENALGVMNKKGSERKCSRCNEIEGQLFMWIQVFEPVSIGEVHAGSPK